MKNLQQQFNLIKEGKGDKNFFLKCARNQFPQYINQYSSYDSTVKTLLNKNIISETIKKEQPKENWFKIFEDNVKAVNKETTKEVTDMVTKNFDFKDEKNIDNIYGEAFLKGFYTEMGDSKNKEKTVDELKQIVAKNLAKDRLYYVKDGQFGIKGLGYSNDQPGLGEPKAPKGKYKSSGYGDLPKEKLNESSQYQIPSDIKSLEKYGVKIILNVKNKVSPIQKIGIPINLDDNIYSKIEDILDRHNLTSKKYPLKESRYNDKNIVKYSKPNNTWQVWKGDVLVTDFATKERAKEEAKRRNNLQGLNEEIDPTYTHFALRKLDQKILTGWEYNGVDKEDIKYYSKMDIKDMDENPKEYTVITLNGIKQKGIDPFDESNWVGMINESHKDNYSLYLGHEIIYSSLPLERLKSVLYSLQYELDEDLEDFMIDKVDGSMEPITASEFFNELDLNNIKPFDNLPSLKNKINQLSESEQVRKAILPNKKKGVANKISIKSALEKIIQQAWGEKDLETAKQLVIDFVTNSQINDVSKNAILNNVNDIRSKPKLDLYLANALLKFEKMGIRENINKYSDKIYTQVQNLLKKHE